MSRAAVKEFIKSRPSIFWWTLANALAAAFAIASWSVCLYLFKFPERPWNYEMLLKLGRLTEVKSYDPLDAPDGSSAEPPGLLKKFYSLTTDQLLAHNRHFKRNYITNFRKPEVVNYVEGSYRVLRWRSLTEDDFMHPGLVLQAQATVLTDELAQPSLYPVVLELLLPLAEAPPETLFPAGHTFVFKKIDHRVLILHASQTGGGNEPSVCLTAVPVAFKNFKSPDGTPLPLTSPDSLNLEAPFPVLEENRGD